MGFSAGLIAVEMRKYSAFAGNRTSMSLMLAPQRYHMEPQVPNISSDYTFADVGSLSTSMCMYYVLKGILIPVELT
jgi:hypothetical protein